jgi:CRP/FNR family transcriptional regulator, cyclic AMP receptor protein
MASVVGSDELYALLARAGDSLSVSAGETIFDKGERGDRMYVLSGGTVALSNGEQVVETATAPGIFGEMALIDDAPRALTAVAHTDVQMTEIPARHFWVLVHETPYFAQLVMSVMAGRLRRAGGTT